MKQRSKILLALLLSASVAATPMASVSVFAEDLDFVAVEDNTDTSAEDDFDSEETSVIAEDNAEADDFASEETNLFSAGEVDATDQADTTETKTHSIKVTVTNSSGVVSGMYAMDSAVVTRQEDGTYLVRIHQTKRNRNYIALTDDQTKANNHEVDWYVAGGADGYWFTVPVASLTDPVYACFSSKANISAGKAWSNPQTITFDVSSMTETTEADAVASDMNIQKASVSRTSLTVTNTTGMFNVTDALLTKDTEKGNTLTVTLHGAGYHYLYKGTYEEAVANGNNRDNWIAGEEVNGKWQFKIPVGNDETFLPIVAISNSYLTKYENGLNTLERAFYPRQAVIDETAATLTTGDYDHTKDLTVSNSVKMFKVDAATLETVGGPNSNNYKEVLHLTMGSDSFDKVYIGSAEDAAKAETTTAIAGRKADLTVKANAMGGATTTDYLEKEVVFSFHSVKNDSWYERVFTISKANGTLTITPVKIPTPAPTVTKVTKVTVTASARNIAAGKKVQLKAAVAPSKATNKAVTWKSSNTKVATVSSKGVVTFSKKAGGKKVTITATAKDGSKKYGKITLTCMKGSVKKITLSGVKTLKAGKTTKVKAKVTTMNGTANKTLTWTSSNTKIATVDKTGKVKAVKGKKGTVTITAKATDGSGKKATIKIKVK